jgi:hypothetical protein
MIKEEKKEVFARVQTTIEKEVDTNVRALAKDEMRKTGTMYRVLILEALKARNNKKG